MIYWGRLERSFSSESQIKNLLENAKGGNKMRKMMIVLAMVSLLVGCTLSNRDTKNLQSLTDGLNSWTLQQQKERKEAQERAERQMERQQLLGTDCTGFI